MIHLELNEIKKKKRKNPEKEDPEKDSENK